MACALSVLGAMYRWQMVQGYWLTNPFAGIQLRGAGRTNGKETHHVFSAIRPFFGFSKARDASLLSGAHTSWSISAFSGVSSEPYGSLAPRKVAWRTNKLSSV